MLRVLLYSGSLVLPVEGTLEFFVGQILKINAGSNEDERRYVQHDIVRSFCQFQSNRHQYDTLKAKERFVAHFTKISYAIFFCKFQLDPK